MSEQARIRKEGPCMPKYSVRFPGRDLPPETVTRALKHPGGAARHPRGRLVKTSLNGSGPFLASTSVKESVTLRFLAASSAIGGYPSSPNESFTRQKERSRHAAP